jgi:DNA-binding transcriptional LysR family regulator
MGRINPARLKLSQLRALVAIADTGSFSEAALKIDLSQSAVSHAIATLEEELGVVVLNRGRQGAVLTPIGQQITQDARQVLKALDNVCRKAEMAKGLEGGEVRIAAFRSVATHILPDVIRQFRQKYPAIAIAIDEKFHYQMVEDDLRRGKADVGFTYLPTHEDFEHWELMRDRYVVLLSQADRTGSGGLTWEELASYPLILGPQHDADRQTIERHLQRNGQHLSPTYAVREDSTILSMVERGLGAAIMAELAAEPIPSGLQVLNLPAPLERVIGVIVLRKALLPPPVFAFLETLKDIWRSSAPKE